MPSTVVWIGATQDVNETENQTVLALMRQLDVIRDAPSTKVQLDSAEIEMYRQRKALEFRRVGNGFTVELIDKPEGLR